MKTAAIVVPTYNNSRLTLECIDSLLTYTPDNVPIIIVDDHSEEEDFNKLMTKIPRINGFRRFDICRSSYNIGFGKICNEGSQLVGFRTNIIIFLNNDTIITEQWYHELVSKLSGNVGICGSKLLYPNDKYSQIHKREIKKGTIQHAGIIASTIPHHIYQFENEDFALANVSKTYPYVTGASLAIDRDIFDELGGFNKKYINGCEDIDLCLRARKIGRDVLYCHKSIAFHHETATRRPESSQENLTLFMQEYKQELEEDTHFESKEL